MLRGIRQASANWLGKAVMTTVMGVLIISFGIWGVADVFRGFGQSTLAKVGHTEISVEQFRQIYNDRLQQIGRQLGKPMTMDQARSIGFDRQVLSQVVSEAALDENVRRLGLGIADADVSKLIMQDPNFRGPSGAFDQARFAQTIRQAGFTEQRYLAEQRRTMLRRQIGGTIAGSLTPPNVLVESLLRVQTEQRNVAFIRLTVEQAGTVDTPTPEALAKFFEERRALFRAPEYRKIAVVTVTPEEVAKWTVVSDDDARKIYSERIERYSTPERRQLRQMVFPNAADAKAARERITAGATFADIAKERGLKASDTDLGLVTKSAVIDPAVADAAFALPLNQVSEPIAGRFGTVLVEVGKIEPGVTPAYESLAPLIKRDISLERARGAVQDIYNKMEDERGGGASVADAAKKLGLGTIMIDAADRSGRTPEGGAVADLPQGIDVMSAAFASDVGVENDALQYRNGYLWIDVLGVTPSRERTLDEVKDDVAKRWREDQVSTRLQARAAEMLKTLGAGTSFADMAAGASLKVETATALTRGSPGTEAAPQSLVAGAFGVAKGGTGQVQGKDPTERLVFQVTDITVPPVDLASQQAKTLIENLRRAQADELIGAYIGNLERRIGTTINQAAFANATGASSN
jgi:peptidyl-prolyl cis-trans isomerase D